MDLQASLDSISRQHAEGCVKIAEDLHRYRIILEATQPDILIECGTFSGKSALWFSRRVPRVLTIDTDPHVDPEIAEALKLAGVRQLVGSSLDVVDEVKEWVRCVFGHDFSYPTTPSVMVVLDSDHSAAHVLAEMHAYGPMVTKRCYMVVEDGLLRHMPPEEQAHYQGNPLDAIEEYLAVHGDRWHVNTELENLHPATQHPSGWLQRL